MPEYFMPRFGVDEEVKFTFINEPITGTIDEVSEWFSGGFMYTVIDTTGKTYKLFDPMENVNKPSPLNIEPLHVDNMIYEVYR